MYRVLFKYQSLHPHKFRENINSYFHTRKHSLPNQILKLSNFNFKNEKLRFIVIDFEELIFFSTHISA